MGGLGSVIAKVCDDLVDCCVLIEARVPSGNPGAKYKALISDAKKFQRKTITFTNQVIDMANQWDLQRQRIQRLEKEKGKLEDQLKEARLIIEQLQSKQL